MSFHPTCVDINAAGDELAVGGDDNKTHVYRVADAKIAEVHAIETRSPVSAVAFNATGDLLAVGDTGRQVEVHAAGAGGWQVRVKGLWVFHTSRITCLAWSPAGNYLASGSLDENIFIWSLAKPSSKTQISFTHSVF